MERFIREVIEPSKKNPKFAAWANLIANAQAAAERLKLEFPKTMDEIEDPLSAYPYYDKASHTVDVNGEKRHLGPAEAKIFEFLARNSFNERYTQPAEIKDYSTQGFADYNYAYIVTNRLRGKIEVDPANPRRLISHRLEGYFLVPEQPSATTTPSNP